MEYVGSKYRISDLRSVVFPQPGMPVMIVVQQPLIKYSMIAIGMKAFSSVINFVGAMDGAESNFLTQKHHDSAIGGLATATREPFFITDTLNPVASVGMITMEDLLEEIVGEIRDEFDEDEKELIKKISDLEYVVEGNMKLDDLNDAIGSTFESEDYDSIGGIVMELLDKLPEQNEEATTDDGYRLVVEEAKDNRIRKVRIFFPEPPVDEDEKEPEEAE